ncbi:MAG: hypothetical protein U9M95_06740 [Candidatus Altiarchaeota archaeon]|nr:hypothetical protein [Candidatus Altiarchaeota archaeon]
MRNNIILMGAVIMLLLTGCVEKPSKTTTTQEIKTTTTDTPTASIKTTTTSTSTTMTECSIPEIKGEGRYGIPFFGIEEDFIQTNDLTSLTTEDIRELGVKIARTHGGPFVWDIVEPTKGTYNFTLTDEVVSQAADSEVTLLASLWPYALWDQGSIESCKVGGKIDAMRDRIPDYRCIPQDMQSHNIFLKELVERYVGDDDYGTQPITEEMKAKIRENPVRYWEINNEVDVGNNIDTAKFFQGTVEEYVDLMENSYNSIKEVCSDCQVIIAAPAADTKGFYTQVFNLGGRTYFDIYNLHCPIEVLKEFINPIDKPVIMTEAGGRAGAKLAIEAVTLAFDGVDSAMLTMTVDRAKVKSKNLEEDPKKKSTESFKEGFLLDGDGGRTSAYTAMKILTHELSGFKRVQSINTGKEVTGYSFLFNHKGPVRVYYVDKEGNEQETITVEGEATIKDINGNIVKKTGSITIEKDNFYFVS